MTDEKLRVANYLSYKIDQVKQEIADVDGNKTIRIDPESHPELYAKVREMRRAEMTALLENLQKEYDAL